MIDVHIFCLLPYKLILLKVSNKNYKIFSLSRKAKWLIRLFYYCTLFYVIIKK